MKQSNILRELFYDTIFIFFSIILAVIILKTNSINILVSLLNGRNYIISFIAGIFLTSIFTTAPAIAIFGTISQTSSLWLVALFGALGSVVGDVLIFRFVRDRFSEHVSDLFKHRKGVRQFRKFFRFRSFRWMSFLIGAFIIASPFPDELGVSLLGFSKLRLRYFIPLSFMFNFIGIWLIGYVTR